MFTLRPIVASILSVCLLQACDTTPAKKELAMQPLLRISHSSEQSAETYYQLGKYEQEHGRFDLATDAYSHSIALASRLLEPRNALAAILAQQGRLDEAKSMLLQIVADYPAVAHPYNNLGYVCYLQGDFGTAITILQRALAMDSSNEQVRNNLKLAQAAAATQGELAKISRALALAAVPKDTSSDVTEVNHTQGNAAILNARVPPQTRLEPRTAPAALAVVEPPSAEPASPMPQSRMELVQVMPNVYQLQLKNTVAPLIAQRQVILAPLTSLTTLTPAASAVVAASAANVSRVEVSNGNGVTGMAKRIEHLLGQHGIAVSRLTNALPYTQQTTKIQYRSGYEPAAVALKNALQGHAVVVMVGNLSSRSDVRLVLGKDASVTLALIEGAGVGSRLALNDDVN